MYNLRLARRLDKNYSMPYNTLSDLDQYGPPEDL
jgi:hypothetical protein